MSKYHKYIVFFYMFICIVLLSICFFDNKPIKNAKEITMDLETEEYMTNEFEFENFNNYESNFIKKNELKGDLTKGRNIYFGLTYKEIMINNRICFATIMSKDEFVFDTCYFNNSNIILISFDVSLYDFKSNDYYIEATTNYDILGVNLSYFLNEKEYGLEPIIYGSSNNIKRISDDEFNYKEFSKNPNVTVSIFIKVPQALEYQGFLFTLYKYEVITEKKSISLGLNKFVDTSSPIDRLLFINSYIELGGND